MGDLYQALNQSLQELLGLSIWAWCLLAISAALLFVGLQLGLWISRLIRRVGREARIARTGFHKSVLDSEVAFLQSDRQALGLGLGEAIVLRWRTEAGRAFEMKLRVVDRYRRRGIFSEDQTIALSETNFARLQEFLGVEEDAPVLQPVDFNAGWWPGDHPDTSVRMGFWITVWITVLTTVVAVLIEYLVP